MTNHVWKPWRPQVQDKEDTEEDVDPAEKKKKLMKAKMENDNVVMCHSLQKKQKENTEEIDTASTPHTLNMWPSCQRTSKLPCHICNEKQK